VSQQPCVEEETLTSGASAADSTVGTTAADSDESEHSENQGDDTKETTRSEVESSSKKAVKTPKVAFNAWFGTILVRFLSPQRFVAEISTLVADRIFHFD